MKQSADVFGKVPPQNLDAERALIGSVIFDDRVLDDVSAAMKPEYFYLDAHGKIFTAFLAIQESGDVVDAITVPAQLRKKSQLEEIGGESYLVQCIESVRHSGHAKYYSKIIKEMWIARQVIYTCTELLSKAYQGGNDVLDVLQDAEQMIVELAADEKQVQAVQIATAASVAMDRWTSERPSGIDLGYRDIDGFLRGAKPGQLIVVAARPGVGKSAFVGSIATFVGQTDQVFFASLEMTIEELLDRMAVSSLGISLDELPQWASGRERDEVEAAVEKIKQFPIVVNESPEQSIASISAQCRQLKRRGGLGLVIVDYLQLLTPANARDSREVQVSKIAWGLKGLAKTLSVPVIALAQLNREIDKRPDKAPRLSDLRESGGIEQAANVVLFLDRPHMYDASKQVHEAIVTISKNRGGRTGRVDLVWEPRCATFRDQKPFGDDFNIEDMGFN